MNKPPIVKGSRGQVRSWIWITFILMLLILLISGYVRQQVFVPCRDTLTYRIGTVDARFKLTQEQAAQACQAAAGLWNNAMQRTLLREDPKGMIEINFIYDYRQATSNALQGINTKIENTKASYESLKAMLESMKDTCSKNETVFKAELKAYNAHMEELKNKITAATNRDGTLSREDYNTLQAERGILDTQRQNLEEQQAHINKSIETINALVSVINNIAANLNLEVVNYNKVGAQLGEEFKEGFFENKNGQQTISIYRIMSHAKMVRILAHEFGHALGLGHNESPRALMYRLNVADTPSLAPEDIAALQQLCNKP